MAKKTPTALLAALIGALISTGAACKKEPRAVPPPSTSAPASAAPPAAPATAAPATAAPATAAPAIATTAQGANTMFDRLAATPLKTLSGSPTSLEAFRGRALLLVNVASQCGLTPQYTALEALQKEYGARGLTVIGFPCNQFAGQEPGSAEQIAEFCSSKFGVTFPMMEKIEVNGPGAHPIYQALTQVADATGHAGDIRWNFEKFVISADGKEVVRFAPKITPDDPAVIAAIKAALPAR